MRTGAEPSVGIPIPRSEWAWAFGRYRTYEAHRSLSRFGLIDVELPEGRRADGTVEGGGDEDAEHPYEAHVFHVVDDGLGYDAATTVTEGLTHAHGLDIEEARSILRPFAGIVSGRPDGWRYTRAKAALDEAKVAL